MKVILLEEVRGKGGEGDVVDVARGFANNYLLRNHMAVKATEGNLKQLEQRRKNIAKREEVRIANAEALKSQLEGTEIVVKAKVGEEGQLFGSVTTQMVVDGIMEEKGIEVDRRRVDIRQAIKQVGEHEVEISIYREIKAVVKIIVVDEDNPDAILNAEEQAEGTDAAQMAEDVAAAEIADAQDAAAEGAAGEVEADVETAAAAELVAELAAEVAEDAAIDAHIEAEEAAEDPRA